MSHSMLLRGLAWAVATLAPAATAAQVFTYQGELALGGQPVTNSCDLRFELYAAPAGGSPVAGPFLANGVIVVDGRFDAIISGWPSAAWEGLRWLEIAVACPGGGQPTTLSPRTLVTSAPTAVLAHLSASTEALQMRPVSAAAPATNQVLKWNGTEWAPAADANTTYTAGSGLILTTTQFSVNLAGSGSAITVSRSDHNHFGQSWSGSAGSALYLVNSYGNVDNYARLATNLDGVVGYSNTLGGWGVHGIQGAIGELAGRFSGNVTISGNLSKAGGSFEIDHPLDPENMVLRHSFVESPDMMNVYNGNVSLDERGEAWIDLPEWFEALNKAYRYQLTAIGGPAPNLHVAQEVHNNRFRIAGGEAGMRVSWQVTGIRHDPWAEANRIVVEEYKAPDTRGFYLYPELYGRPAYQSMEWALRPQIMQQLEERR
jgi:hypothetical protein